MQGERVLRLYMLMLRNNRGITIKSMMEATGVTRRTINRDLLILQIVCRVDVLRKDELGNKYWGVLQ